MNHVVLTACIAELGSIRYTPAGLPALDLKLEHESQAQEAGQTRQVKVTIKAVAFGPVAQALAGQPPGSGFRFTGFLANPRSGKHPALHIQEFSSVPHSPAAAG